MSVFSALSHALRFGYVRGMYIFDMTHAVHAVSLKMVSSPLSGFDHMTGVSSGVRAHMWHTHVLHVSYTCHTSS